MFEWGLEAVNDICIQKAKLNLKKLKPIEIIWQKYSESLLIGIPTTTEYKLYLAIKQKLDYLKNKEIINLF